MAVNTVNIISDLLKPERVKNFLQVSALVLLAYKIGEIVPGLITISLGTWMNRVFTLAPYIALVFIISMWNPSGDRLHFNLRLPSITNRSSSTKCLLLLSTISLVIGFIMLWLLMNFASFMIIGYFVLFGSAISILVIGATKPALGPVIFFAAYPFLWFTERRTNSSLYYLLHNLPNKPAWLQSIVFDMHSIHIVMLMFAIGFLFFYIRHLKPIRKTMLDIPIVLLLIWTFLSVITSNDRSVALNAYFLTWIFPVTFYYATLIATNRKGGIREIKVALVALLFFACMFDIQNLLITGESAWSEELSIKSFGEGRAMVWTIVAYQIGPWIVIIFPLAFSLLFDQKERFHIRLFSFLAITIGFLMSVWEMQRAVIVALVVMVVLAFMLYHRSRLRQLLIYAILGIVAVLLFDELIGLLQLVRPSIIQSSIFAESNYLDRKYLIEQGWDLIKNNPVFGIGPGAFKFLHIGFYAPEVSSHNMFIETALESGVIALFLLLIVLLLPVSNAVLSFIGEKHIENDADLRPWIISLSAFYVYLMTHEVWSNGEGAVVFCMLGVLVGLIKKELNTSFA